MNKKEFLLISIGFFLTIIAWLVIDIYHIQTRKEKNLGLAPISMTDYKISKKILDILLEKKLE